MSLRTRSYRVWLASALGATLLLASCGGGGSTPAARSPADASSKPSTAGPAGPPSIAARCGSAYEDLQAGTFWFKASDGLRLDGATIGGGATTVILAHQYPSDLCGWVDYAVTLAHHGYRAFLFDFRGAGESAAIPNGNHVDLVADVKGAVAEARRRGAKRTFLVGASLGGTAVMAASEAVRPPVNGVVSLSGEPKLEKILGPSYAFDVAGSLAGSHVPLLLMGARGDAYVPVPGYRRLVESSPAARKRAVILPGVWHGWDLVYAAPYKARVNRILYGFYSPGRAHD